MNALILYLSFQWLAASFIWKQLDSPLKEALDILKNNDDEKRSG